MPHKDFTDYAAAARQHKKVELTFALDGETYHVIDYIPSGLLLDLFTTAASSSVPQFLRDVVIPDERRKIRAALFNQDRPISLEIATEIATWIVEEDAGRPTLPPGESASGPPSTGPTSNQDSTEQASPSP